MNRKILILIFTFLIASFVLLGQGMESGELINYVTDQLSSYPGADDNEYKNPSEDEKSQFLKILEIILEEDYAMANDLAEMVEYQVILFKDKTLTQDQEFVILQKTREGSNFWGTYIFNPGACRNVIIECPHPIFDTNTGIQGAYIFSRIKVKGLFIAGTHRCNSISSSTCSGSTSVCGDKEKYRKSDVAHNDKSIFQVAHNKIADEDEETICIQLHGFGKKSGDPNLIISNGTRDTPKMDPIASLRSSLLDADQYLTFRIPHIHTDWTRLTAFTNTQGRYLNKSSDVCHANAVRASGKFIHIEQELKKFRQNEEGWKLMMQGIQNAFSCSSTSVNEVINPTFTVYGNRIQFDPLQINCLIQVYHTDGRIWLSEKLSSSESYLLPEPISIVTLRDMSTGKLLFSKIILSLF